VAWWYSQTRLIFPGAVTRGRPEAALPPGADCEVVQLLARDGTRIVGRFGAAPAPGAQVTSGTGAPLTVAFFCGNASCIAQNDDEFSRFRRLGCNAMMADYAGFGLSGGVPSEGGCYATADAVYDHLVGRRGIDPNRIVLAGRSLGAAVAIDLASRRPTAGLIAVSPFTSMYAMARRTRPWWPTRMLLRHHFDNLAKIPSVACPILFIHGSDDDFVAPGMADVLAASARSRVERLAIPSGNHRTVMQADEERLWAGIAAFLGTLR
jgi:fermentation-respiration switch protein FrsA (DUF1100 family)